MNTKIMDICISAMLITVMHVTIKSFKKKIYWHFIRLLVESKICGIIGPCALLSFYRHSTI
jgi:hypothetical protein